MLNKLKEQMKDVKVFVLNIVIAVLIFFLLIIGFYFVEELIEAFDRGYSENSMMYRIEDGNYGSLVQMYHTNEIIPVKAGKEMQEYYAAAQYFEAASYYKAFSETGDAARAEKYLKKMNEAAEEMGGISFVKDNVDAVLEIN